MKFNKYKMQPLKILLVAAISLFSLNGFSQTPIKNYTKEWANVNDLINKKRLPKSALAEVKKIYELAKKENQEAQVIKSLVYMSRLQQEIREHNYALSIADWEKELAISKEPAKSILNMLLAEIYLSYLQSNRWKLYNRTETVNFKKDDLETWSVGDFHRKISQLYHEALKNKQLLQQTSLQRYDAIIEKGNMRHLRPTLYDLVAHRALEYYKSPESNLSKPAYAFEIKDTRAFAPAEEFVRTQFITRDTSSLLHRALLLYQELISFHLKDTRPDAFLDVDIHRLDFVHDYSTHPGKKELYRTALSNIFNKYPNLPAASQAGYLIAESLFADGENYHPLRDTANRYAKVRAKEILDRIVAQKDSSEGKVNAMNLISAITYPQYEFKLEKVNIPGQPFRSLVSYKNVEKLYFRIVKPTEDLNEEIGYYIDTEGWKKLLALRSERSWQQSLPKTNDYQGHSVEIKVDALPPGEYLLLASNDNFSKNSIIGARLFYVSNISFMNQGADHFVLHRETGQPLNNATVQVWNQTYDYSRGKGVVEKGRQYKTDGNGFFRMVMENIPAGRRENYKLDITWNNERLYMNDWIYDQYLYLERTGNARQEPLAKYQVFFFNDRSIYRPGQTVYFKGIVIANEGEIRNKILENYKTRVYLRDVNYQIVDSMDVTTNEFGSFNGTFQLPQGTLNGQFYIVAKDDRGQSNFSVEEYKRPKFAIEYEKIKESYKVGDRITITGTAKAYAGNNIDGAKVVYRVFRQPRFIYPWLLYRGWWPQTPPMEITQGEITTDKDGKFTISFEAIPDESINPKFEPVFDYRIAADVTDINGETRTGQTLVSAGYKSLLLRVDIPSSLSKDSLRSSKIFTQNMNGQFIPSNVRVTVYRLNEERRLIRERLWDEPDQFVMTKADYLINFPHDEYSNEADPEEWEKINTVFQASNTTKEDGSWNMPDARNWEEGWYAVEIITTDKDGKEVKDVRYIELYDANSNRLASIKYLWKDGPTSIEPGESTTVKIGSSASEIFLIQQVSRNTYNQYTTKDSYEFTRLNNEKKTFSFTASEADRGGYGIRYFFVKHNRVYYYSDVIRVPWTNKDLTIEYSTFRDKTLPGSEEQWKIRITGYKKELVAAEMLASMYDASLDQFRKHEWSKLSIWPEFSNFKQWNYQTNFSSVNSQVEHGTNQKFKPLIKDYDDLIRWWDARIYGGVTVQTEGAARRMAAPPMVGNEQMKAARNGGFDMDADGVDELQEVKVTTISAPVAPIDVQARKNFNETAFFFPALRTDANGAIEFTFTIPEALTKWKFQAFAHTKGMAMGYTSKDIITQKQLMVQPNAPRFLREGDKIEFSAKIVNMTEKELTGQAQLLLFDATTNQPVDGWFRNTFPNQYFTVAAGQSEAVNFPIDVPYQFNKALVWRIVARSGDFSDGEEAAMPVLTNRMLVTESLPVFMRGAGSKTVKFDKLLNAGSSETLQHHALTIEYTSNPVWYAVQALPYLMEYPYECAEQVWNRYYANALASHIANSSPRIKQIFESWKTKDTAALLSNLQKNQELKAVLLEETPWVLQAKNEEQQKKNIALLFDLVRMCNELKGSLEKLKQMQAPNGGFVWFKGGPDDRFITQYIITGIGHLQKLTGRKNDETLTSILRMGVSYLDKKIKEDYDRLVKSKADLKKQQIGYYEIQYLYMRSFFNDIPVASASQKAYTYYRGQSKQFWMKQSKYMQGMIALALHRTDDKTVPVAITKSLKETSISNEELGMYWKDQSTGGWFWFQAPIEMQALMIETFTEIGNDTETVDDLRTWLLKNKQTNNWRTTKATAEACYALLLQGTNWATSEPVVEIRLGTAAVSNTSNAEAGTGYFKKTIEGQFVRPEMGNITVNVSSATNNSSWGSVYWQYFEDLDKITTAQTPLKLNKKLFVQTNTDRGPVLNPVNEGDAMKVGDKIKVRIELRVDRDMEYVHMKDMRASSMEPVNVISMYKWQGGLGYYETTKDASTNFFFDRLRKGTYVFEYEMFVTNKGNFSNGITSIQCMYAPEFSAHSEGIRINVE